MKGPFKKNKVVKKKKSKGKKDDWSFEGGGVDSDAKPATEEKQRFRQTQDRDERLRRSRVKLHDRKIKNTFVKKMASKVRLEDVLLAPETFTEEVSPVKEEKAVRPEHRSSLSVLERIQLFVGQSLDDNRRQSLANTVSKTRSTANDEMELDTAIDKLDKEKIKASGSTILQEVSSITPSNATFDWLFVANSKSISSSKWSKIADSISERNESEYSVTGKILECAPIEKFTEVKSFGAIPGLHKVWAGKQDILYKYPMNKVMSYVSKYLDVFLEGRDHRNDLAVMKPIVSHLCAHIVKARLESVPEVFL